METITARALGDNLSISKKFSVEIARFIRGRDLAKAKELLHNVIEKRVAVPFKKYNFDLGHKRGQGPARYPIKAAKAFLILLESAEANAIHKGLSASSLYIKSIIANKGSTVPHYSRHQGRQAKRTHVEVILEEREKVEKKQ